MNVRPAVIIRTRVQRPGPVPEWSAPTRVLSTLSAIPAHRLTHVLAPAGFGKTRCVAGWAERIDRAVAQVAWIRVESGEGGLAEVLAYVQASMATLDDASDDAQPRKRRVAGAQGSSAASSGRHVARILTEPSKQEGDARQRVSAMLAELVGRCERIPSGSSLVLVVDDAHWVDEFAVSELFLRLLREAPAAFHLVWLTRGPGLAIPSELQARGQVQQIGPDLLRVDAEDGAAFVHTVLGGEFPDDTCTFAMELTAGWPLPLQLLLRQLRPPFDLRSAQARLPAILGELERFLDIEVLSGMTPRLVDFLRLTSVSPRLSAALADCLTGSDDGQECLQRLHGAGLVAADAASGLTFTPETLLRRCLSDRLMREAPGHALLLHRRAGAWQAAGGNWNEAVGHALDGADVNQAAAWIEQGAESLLEQGDFQALLDWLKRLPTEVVAARPGLQLVKAWAQTFLHRRSEATQTLASLEAHLADVERDVLAVRSTMTALSDDSAAALQAGQRVLARAPRPGSLADHAAHTAMIFGLGAASRFEEVDALRAGQDPAPGLATQAALYRQNLFAYSAFQAGRLDQAGLIFEEVLAQQAQWSAPARATAAVAAAYLATIHYERNDFERARALLGDRRAGIEASVSLGALLHGLRTAARLAYQDGDLEQGLSTLDEGGALGRRRGQLRLQAGCLGEAVRLRLAQGDTLEADRLLRTLLALGIRAPDDRATAASETWDMVRLAEARMLLAVNAPRRAVPLLRALWSDLRVARRNYFAASVAVVLVRALEAAGDPEGALDPLWQGLIYGQQNGLVRTFADEGLALAGPLARLLPGGVAPPEVDPEYLRRIRLLLDPQFARQTQTRGLIQQEPLLTARETEILQYMARGLSNKEVARALGISPETVKWYLKHIYDKLHVSGRVQAIQVGLNIRVADVADSDMT